MQNTLKEDLQNISEVEMTYKQKVKASLRPKVNSSKDCEEIFKLFFNENTIELKEEFWAMFLSRSNKVIGMLKVSDGGTSGTVVDCKFVLLGLAKLNASGVILCHNHPSGNNRPSAEDINLTKKIKEACRLIDCSLMDHLIITPENEFYSFADEGMM